MTTTEKKLEQLTKAVEQMWAAQRRVDDAIGMLRTPDADGFCEASWSEIAECLGLSKQAVQQRYSRRWR